MNQFLEKMGCKPSDRVLITHIDDMGFCHAANSASEECLSRGSASCASVIVNAGWFLEAAHLALANPSWDIGVHLTLTAEYPLYRWPALSSRDPRGGLIDAQGYLWHTREDAIRHVTEEAAEGEMRAQIDAALAAGIDVTHIDTHMGSVIHPKFLPSYLSLAAEYDVPAFLPRITRARLQALSQGDMADAYLEALEAIDASTVPMLDEIIIETLVAKQDKMDFYRQLIDGIKPGLTHLLFHPAKNGEELSAIADTHVSRHADYLAFCGSALRTHAEQQGIRIIGYRELRGAMRGE
jgi:hypothetical protein